MTKRRALTIVQLLPELNSGGVEKCTLDMAKAIVAAGHRSIVISNGGSLVDQLVAEGSEHFTLAIHQKSLSSLFIIRPLRMLLKSIKPDIVHARSRMPAWLTWLAIRKLPRAIKPHFVTTVHGLNSVNPYSAIMTYGDAVIAISCTVKSFIRANYPKCPPSKLHLIYEGIDQDDFPYLHQPSDNWISAWTSAYPELQNKVIFALPGRITRLKGHPDFFRLIAALIKNGLNVHGLVVGGADTKKQHYLKELKSLANTLGIEQNISFSGQRSDIANVLSQCDVVLSLSTQPETFGRTVLEAIRLGKPVLAWNKGGAGEILSTCYPQGLVPNNDEAALLKTVTEWLKSPSIPEKSVAFLQSTNADMTLNLYQDLVLGCSN